MRKISYGTTDLTTTNFKSALENMSEPTGFNREEPDTMGIFEFSPDGTTIYRIDQNGTYSTTTSGLFAEGTEWETQASTRTLAHYPASGQPDVQIYINSELRKFKTLRTNQIDNVTGLWIFNTANDGTIGHNLNGAPADYFERYPIQTVIYWNANMQDCIIFADERHGIQMDGATHRYLHLTFGTKYVNGLGVAGIAADSTTYGSTLAGLLFDEDLPVEIPLMTSNPTIYFDANGKWEMASDTGVIRDNNTIALLGPAGFAQYNEEIGANSYQLTSLAEGEFMNVMFMATNDKRYPVMKILGQRKFTDLSIARESASTEPRDTVLKGLPTPEVMFIGAVVINHLGEVQTLENGDVFIDLKLANISAGTNTSSAVIAMASDTYFDPTTNTLTSTDVQTAIEEIMDSPNFSGNVTIDGDLIVLGTQSIMNTDQVAIKDTIFILNNLEPINITNVVGNGVTQVYTTAVPHEYSTGFFCKVEGVNPAGYNFLAVQITVIDSTSFSIAGTKTDAYVSGGTVVGKSNTAADIGFAGWYYNGVAPSMTGLFRDITTNRYKFFENYQSEITNEVLDGSYGFTLSDIEIKGINFTNATEKSTVIGNSASGTVTIYRDNGALTYYTANAGGNWTINLTHSTSESLNLDMDIGDTATFTFITPCTTAYYNTSVQVDGTTTGVTTKWQGQTPVTGYPNAINTYTYTVIKTGSATFTVLATQNGYL